MGLAAETFPEEGTMWEKVRRTEATGVLAKEKTVVQAERRGQFPQPADVLLPRSLGGPWP